MYELENEITRWKKGFDHHKAMRYCDMEELEQHVRDSIVELTTKGLSEEEAFLIATRRVGEPEAVGREFEKVNGGAIGVRRILALPTRPMALVLLNIISFCAIVWIFDAQMSDLRRSVGPLRAAQEGSFVVEKDVFLGGGTRLYAPLEFYDSVGDFISYYESDWLNNHVSVGSYGEEWMLVNHLGRPLSSKKMELSLQEAGIKPGAVWQVKKVVKNKDGSIGFI